MKYTVSKGLLVCALFALVSVPRHALAQGEVEPDVNWAYASFFGTGWYKISDERDVFSIRVSPRWETGEAGFDEEGNRDIGYTFRVPFTVGLARLDFDDIPGILDKCFVFCKNFYSFLIISRDTKHPSPIISGAYRDHSQGNVCCFKTLLPEDTINDLIHGAITTYRQRNLGDSIGRGGGLGSGQSGVRGRELCVHSIELRFLGIEARFHGCGQLCLNGRRGGLGWAGAFTFTIGLWPKKGH